MSDLHVERCGPEGAPDVVLVHGWAMHGRLWGDLIDALSQSFRLHVVDLPGHGFSGGEFPSTDIDAWAAAVLNAAPPRAAWVGWSLGGLIAQAAALRQPERVSMLGLLASTPSFIVREGWPSAVDVDALHTFASALAKNADATLSRFLSLQVRGAENATTTLRSLRAALAARPLASPAAMNAGLALLLNSDLRAQLSDLAVPVTALFGDRDTLIPVEAAQGLQALLPNAHVEILPGAGHAPFWSHPRVVCDILGSRLSAAI